jgi:hypothetical protein
VISTAVGGYLVFAAIVTVFHSWLAGEQGALRSALVEGSILVCIVVGLFSASAWMPPRRR